ncbi:MAG TPA: hypothetical protein VGC00_14600 [Thermoanaerobaculia bacterium]
MRATGAMLVAAALAAACGGAGESGSDELATVDVTPQPDAAASLEADAVARPVGLAVGGIAGALPEDFPPEVPLPSPSSLVDFGSTGAETSVTLAVDLPAERVEETYRRQLAAAGFRVRADGSFAGRGHTLRYTVEPFHGAARLTVRVARP